MPMNLSNLSIATITWARDNEEEMLLRKSLQQLSTLGMNVYITDGGSDNDFLDFLKSFPNFVMLKAEEKGVFAQAKKSLSEAYKNGSSFILYTEPDKLDFFKNGLPRMLHEVTVDEHSGVITASRSKKGFATFPAFQQMTETTINNCCSEIIGNRVDYTYGPFILNRKLAPYLELIQEDIGWGWRPFVFNIAKRLGYTIKAFEDDFSCPPSQQQDNAKERIYRMKQLSQNINGLVLSTSIDVLPKL
jgi:hypothetical protein